MANICGWMCIFLHTYTCKYIHKEIYIYCPGNKLDIYMNTPEVVLATIKGARGSPRVSAHTLQQVILRFYTEAKLYPSGVYSDIPAVQTWALKYGMAIKKLVPLPKIHEHLFSFHMLSVFSSSSPVKNTLQIETTRLVEQNAP